MKPKAPHHSRPALPYPEFVVLLALMISIVAMSIDMMLSTLDAIGRDLNVSNANDAQMVIVSLTLGFAAGQIFAGPLSDAFGRKPIIYLGFGMFIAGSLISMLTPNWELMLAGRVLQGLGCAGPRIVTIALIRDRYEGNDMARIMSIVMGIFICVPAIVPALGHVIAAAAGWRAIFAFFVVLSTGVWLWFGLRQPETLPQSKRRAFSIGNLLSGLKLVVTSRISMGYTIATGLVFGGFLGYLSTAQQIYLTAFDIGPLFVIYFGVSSLSVGLASVLNASLVTRFGMRPLTWWAIVALMISSFLFLIPVLWFQGIPPFWSFLLWLNISFFCIGILFGNLNAIAMEPLGAIAGLGAAFVGSISNFISLPFAFVIGQAFDGGVTALVLGYAVLASVALATVYVTERTSDGRHQPTS